MKSGKVFFYSIIPLIVLFWAQSAFPGQATEDARPKSFMISFDDGPHPSSTPYILEEINKIKNREGLPVKVAFFLIGKDKSGSAFYDVWTCRKTFYLSLFSPFRKNLCPDPGIEANHEIVRALAAAGHYVMVHSVHHAELDRLDVTEIESEILDCHESLIKTGIDSPKYFRPPYLRMPSLPPDSRLIQEGWKVIMGIPSGDGSPFATERSVIEHCKKQIEQQQTPPALLIFHDFRALGGHRFNFAAIIGELVNSGYYLEDFDPHIVGRVLDAQSSEQEKGYRN